MYYYNVHVNFHVFYVDNNSTLNILRIRTINDHILPLILQHVSTQMLFLYETSNEEGQTGC